MCIKYTLFTIYQNYFQFGLFLQNLTERLVYALIRWQDLLPCNYLSIIYLVLNCRACPDRLESPKDGSKLRLGSCSGTFVTIY